MKPIDPLRLPAGEQFSIGASDMSFFDNRAERCSAGALFCCRRGTADLMIDDFAGTMRRNTVAFLFPGSLLSFGRRSDDFRVELVVFSASLFAEAVFPLDFDFMRIVKQHPLSALRTEDVPAMNMWLGLVTYDFERGGKFRDTIVRNRLQNALMEACDKVMERTDGPSEERSAVTTRQGELFGRFAELVRQHCRSEREVAFYAAQLCVSTRYLTTIARSVSGHSAKTVIDGAVILEIKQLLRSTTLSVQEIAYRLHFPDQSYLGRFFRKHTGVSPSQFRKSGR